ncbi:MAG: glucose-6-phosphate isomerase [Planctomycetes bacterium]|nr:glucose-6-phosphate isomerase [Planctomycetota bacterium]
MNLVPSYDVYRDLLVRDEHTGLEFDFAFLGFEERHYASFGSAFERVFREMRELEAGAIANPDENRAVGHYWLRAPELAPGDLGATIEAERSAVQSFARDVKTGTVFPPRGGRYTTCCLIGIGGSALGPQLVIDALGDPHAGLQFVCLDNTDPDGIARTLGRIELATTLFVVISKSGGTKETRNAMLEAAATMKDAGLDFANQAVAVTGRDSELDRHARDAGWIARFPMHDWVGGRTSVCSAVGILPCELCGVDMSTFLDGAKRMDESTRDESIVSNPAARLTIALWLAAEGRGSKNLVVLPYCDRLLLLGRYLQQLVMESLGKALDLEGKRVAQGLTVYGNKGSTDQHAYVQQLRDGVEDFFACFVRVLSPGGSSLEVDPGVTSADYLHGFWLGTRRALAEQGRRSLTITVPQLGARELGMLVALFERVVGFYASLAGINAYHQPGVEAGKRGASDALALRAVLLDALDDETPLTVEELAARVRSEDLVTAHELLRHMAANGAVTGVEAVGSDRFRRVR